jgi:hypothetical protein
MRCLLPRVACRGVTPHLRAFRFFSSLTPKKVEDFGLEEPEYLQELMNEAPRSSSFASGTENQSVTIGRSHRLSIEMLPDEATESDVMQSVQEIVGVAPVSVELYTQGRKQRNALVLLESEAVLQMATTPSRLLFGVYVCRQRCPMHDAKHRVASLWIGRLPFSQSAIDVEQAVRSALASVVNVKVWKRSRLRFFFFFFL